MKLFYSPGSCALAPHIVLHELGLPFRGEKVDLKSKTFSGGDFKSINPKGSVPVLELEDGTFLTENAVILQFLADQKPEKKLIPKAGTMERYRNQEWLNFIATEIHKSFSPLFSQAHSEEAKNLFKENLAKKFDIVSKQLSQNQFICGDHYTVADSYLFTVLRWARPMKIDLSKWPALLGFSERINHRPATQEALKEEGLNG
jgi:glutathione S-transferase